MSDAEDRLRALMLRGLAGDATAHAALLRDLAGLVRGYYARRMGADAADLEDLVQETLIAIHTRRASYRTGELLTPWVYAIARYKLISHWRARGRRPTEALDAAYDIGEAGGQEAATAASDLERLMLSLPAKQREAIHATRIAGLSTAEAAAFTGQSEPAVKVSAHRGIRALMARVQGRAVDAD